MNRLVINPFSGFNWMDAMQQDNDVQMRYQPDVNVSNSNY